MSDAPKKKSTTKVREVSSRLLAPTGASSARSAKHTSVVPQPPQQTTASGARAQLHSSQRRREQTKFIGQVVSKVVEPAVHESQKVAHDELSLSLSGSAPLPPGAAADEVMKSVEEQQQHHHQPSSGSVKRHVQFPPLPDALKHPTAESKLRAGGIETPSKSNSNVAGSRTLTIPVASHAAAAAAAVDTNSTSAAAAAAAAPSPAAASTTNTTTNTPPRFQQATGALRRPTAEGFTSFSDTFVVPVPSPWGRGFISKRVRSTTTARSMNPAAQLHVAERETDKLKKQLLHGGDGGEGGAAMLDQNLFIVRRFDDLDDPAAATLLDINMDGNSKPISARKPTAGKYSRSTQLGVSSGVYDALSGPARFGVVGAGRVSESAMTTTAAADSGDVSKSSTPEKRDERKTRFDNFFMLSTDEEEAAGRDPRQERLTDQLQALLRSAREGTQTHAMSSKMAEKKKKGEAYLHSEDFSNAARSRKRKSPYQLPLG